MKLCKIPGLNSVDLCNCSDEACLVERAIQSSQTAGFIVFVALFVVTAGGCGRGVSFGCCMPKFTTVIFVTILLLIAPNSIMQCFVGLSEIVSILFLVYQCVMLVDVGFQLNDLLVRQEQFVWVIVISVVLVFVNIASAAYLYISDEQSCWLILGTSIGAVVLLFVSILDAVEHGNLLTSCVFAAYMVWLCWEVIDVQPGAPQNPTLKVMSIVLAIISISTYIVANDDAGSEGSAMLLEVDVEDGVKDVAQNDDAGSSDFLQQTAVHASLSLYMLSQLCPSQSWVLYHARESCIVMSLLVYGWMLVAPYVLSGRSFS